ncbi:MAG: sulfurtransferase-like selenium metabolism protein YedF [Oscillospiraceae bacterium]|nr:sulfurtransferase-like selenium metabolism protein YedF [Oscillospiraceae bacterium]
MLTVNAMGDKCPIPVVKTKKAIDALTGDETVEVLVDNETAVENVTKAGKAMGYAAENEQLGEGAYRVVIHVVKGAVAPAPAEDAAEVPCCCGRKKVVVSVGSNKMGEGSEELGGILIKSFFFALTQLDELPATIIFYNSGVNLSCEGSPVLEDLKNLAAQGVDIISCGTCLNYYGLKEKLAVGEVSNMYDIVERQRAADLVIKP